MSGAHDLLTCSFRDDGSPRRDVLFTLHVLPKGTSSHDPRVANLTTELS